VDLEARPSARGVEEVEEGAAGMVAAQDMKTIVSLVCRLR